MSIHRVTMSCLVDGQVNQNVIHLENADGAIADATIATTIRDSWLSEIRPFQRTDASWYDIEVRKVPGVNVPYHLTIVLAGTGASSAEQDVPFVCRVLWFQTAVAGKRGRGKLYIPGTTFNAWDRGRVKPVSITAGLPLCANLVSRFTGLSPSTGLSLVVCPRSDPTDVKHVIEITQRVNLGVQRRRGLGVGI